MIYFKIYVLNNVSLSRFLDYFVRENTPPAGFLPWSWPCLQLMIPSCSLCVAFAFSVHLVPKRLDTGDIDMCIYMHMSRIYTEKYIHLSWWDKNSSPTEENRYPYEYSVLLIPPCLYSLFDQVPQTFSPREFFEDG